MTHLQKEELDIHLRVFKYLQIVDICKNKK